MQNVKEFRAHCCIETKYHEPTNRVSARRAERRPGDKTIYLSWDHALDTLENHAAAAMEFCKRENIKYALHPLVASNDQSYLFILDRHIPD